MMKRKNAMVLAEVLAALIICGILFLVSVNMFRGIDLSKKPQIYSTMKNLKEANVQIMDECFEDGTCQTKGMLPNTAEDYCNRLADLFNTTGELICSQTQFNGDTRQDAGNNTFNYNLRLANGVSIYGLTDNDWRQVDGNNPHSLRYIDVLIDVNGPRGENTALREEIFPLRIMINGDVVPGFYNGTDGITKAFEGVENADGEIEGDGIFEYGITLFHTNDTNYAEERSAAITDRDGNIIQTGDLTFRDAVCKAYNQQRADGILRRYYREGEGSFTACGNNEQLEVCQRENNNTANETFVCEVRQVKPKTGGLFRIFGGLYDED